MDGLTCAMWVLCLILIGSSLGSGVKGYEACVPHFLAVDDSCYFFSKGRATWQDAHWKCEHMNSTLVVVDREEVDEALRKVLDERPEGKYERWIGGIYDWKQSVWRWGATGQELGYQGFSSKYDANRRDKLEWHCIVLDPAVRNMWNSRKCTYKKHFICKSKHDISKPLADQQIPEPLTRKPLKRKKSNAFVCPGEMILVGNMCYVFSTHASPWYESHWKCGERNSTLVAVTNRRQDSLLKKFLNKGSVEKRERWLGGMYDWKKKTWRWAIKGQPVRYKNFAAGHSTDPEQLRWHCVTIDPNLNNQWGSELCTDSRHYICQSRAKKVIKLGHKKADAEIIILADGNRNKTLKSGIETRVYPRRKNNRKYAKSFDRGRNRSDYAEIIILNDHPQQNSPSR